MEDLFRSYWWLLFPFSWFVIGGWRSWLNYRSNRDTLDLIKSYAQSGREPPPELLARLNQRDAYGDDDDRPRRRYRGDSRYGGWYQVVLFGVLCMGFTYAAVTDFYGNGSAFVIVAFVMGALSLATLVSTLVGQGPKV
jgi:hypothetical protein